MDRNVWSRKHSMPSRSHHPRQYLPLELSLLLGCFDLTALLLAIISTHLILEWLQPILHIAPTIHSNLSYYCMFGLLIICGCLIKGHYRRRVPWWTQLQFMGLALMSIFALDILIHLTLGLPTPLLQIILLWGIATAMFIAMRLLALKLASKSSLWKLPVVIIGDSQLIMDTLYALYADGMTGYEVKVVLLQGPQDDTIDLGVVEIRI